MQKICISFPKRNYNSSTIIQIHIPLPFFWLVLILFPISFVCIFNYVIKKKTKLQTYHQVFFFFFLGERIIMWHRIGQDLGLNQQARQNGQTVFLCLSNTPTIILIQNPDQKAKVIRLKIDLMCWVHWDPTILILKKEKAIVQKAALCSPGFL